MPAAVPTDSRRGEAGYAARRANGARASRLNKGGLAQRAGASPPRQVRISRAATATGSTDQCPGERSVVKNTYPEFGILWQSQKSYSANHHRRSQPSLPANLFLKNQFRQHCFDCKTASRRGHSETDIDLGKERNQRQKRYRHCREATEDIAVSRQRANQPRNSFGSEIAHSAVLPHAQRIHQIAAGVRYHDDSNQPPGVHFAPAPGVSGLVRPTITTPERISKTPHQCVQDTDSPSANAPKMVVRT